MVTPRPTVMRSRLNTEDPGLVSELPRISQTSKLKSEEWKVFRACGSAFEA